MSDEKGPVDTKAANVERPPADSDVATSGLKEPKKHKKKRQKQEGSKGISYREDSSSPANVGPPSLITLPRSPTSGISGGAAVPPELENTGGAPPIAALGYSPIGENQGRDMQDPGAMANQQIVERKPSKKSVTAVVSLGAPCDKRLSGPKKDNMNIGIALLVGALVTFVVWVVLLALLEKNPMDRHPENETDTTHD
ncbi:uncharacterized protein LOC135399570 [Ornithodoros turicata]|uniref:uncharacterized protein LOC135399570 n=1 Tax=Ornithodoros turicata TaxID=34597 RepID=UPI00313886EE